jgi:hypothetical protein
MIDSLEHLLVKEMMNYLVGLEILDLLTKMRIFQDGVDLIQKVVYHLDSLKLLDLINLFYKLINKFVLGFFIIIC